MNIVTRKLIAKELYLHRWFILATAVAVVASAVAATFGRTAFNVAAITWLTTVIAFGVMLCIYGISNERKENSLHFVLSLPISPADYVRAKLFGLLLTYLVTWLIATGAALALVGLSEEVPDGMYPYVILLCVFLLANFTLVMCGTMFARTEAVIGAVIILTNMMVSFFMVAVSGRAGIQDHMRDAVPAWNNDFFNVLIIELIVLVIAVAFPLATAARRRDFL
ncbi:MAG TPA: ABC-2 transporter permease [Steroidobacteraceae bacterium]|jgi:ABC-type transport system involved in multi-copper enzyme maturation permease subunit